MTWPCKSIDRTSASINDRKLASLEWLVPSDEDAEIQSFSYTPLLSVLAFGK